MVKIILHNTRYDDEVKLEFDGDTLTDEMRQQCLNWVKSRGWNEDDWWSEVKETKEWRG